MGVVRSVRRTLFPGRELRRDFRRRFGRELDLVHPQTFSEKIYRQKLLRDPRLTVAVDKVRVKSLVAQALGPEWVVPMLWHGRRLPPRAERTWPLPFVVKANHGSGWNRFVVGEEDRNWVSIEADCTRWLATTYGLRKQEWAYRNVPPQVLVEPYMGCPPQRLTDYRFFVFGGRVEFINADFRVDDREFGNFYDRAWRRQPFSRVPPAHPSLDVNPPAQLDRMIQAAETLAADFSFVRVDLYDVGGRPYFGEMTFYPGAGHTRFDPPHYDLVFGGLWPERSTG